MKSKYFRRPPLVGPASLSALNNKSCMFRVEVDHLNHTQLSSFIELLELIYSSRVTVAPTRSGDGQWLDIKQMYLSEAGLRVASRLYRVPFEPITKKS